MHIMTAYGTCSMSHRRTEQAKRFPLYALRHHKEQFCLQLATYNHEVCNFHYLDSESRSAVFALDSSYYCIFVLSRVNLRYCDRKVV